MVMPSKEYVSLEPRPTPYITQILGHKAMDDALLRAFAMMSTGGAALGECLATSAQITPGNPYSWQQSWAERAKQTYQEAQLCLKAGNTHSASTLLGRASIYFHLAHFFLLPHLAEKRSLYIKSLTAFKAACPLWYPPCEPIAIPLSPEGTITLPGYFVRASSMYKHAPTLIILGGLDSSAEEMFFLYGKTALDRGMNILLTDIPGSMGMLSKNIRHSFEPRFEGIFKHILNYTLRRPEVSSDHLALMGISLGGYFALRAACHTSCIKALILNTPICSLKNYLHGLFDGKLDSVANFTLTQLLSLENGELDPIKKTQLAGILIRFGAESFDEFKEQLQTFKVTPAMLAALETPTFAAIGESEYFAAKQELKQFMQFATACKKTQHTFEVSWGSDGHCQVTNIHRFSQVAYDWVQKTLKLSH